jgi:hypothetical protein
VVLVIVEPGNIYDIGTLNSHVYALVVCNFATVDQKGAHSSHFSKVATPWVRSLSRKNIMGTTYVILSFL